MIDLTQTPKRLKLSILNHALSGKLTQQLPSDGTADDLLKPILQKKYELLKNKKIRKHKRLPPIKETPFKIPNNWKWMRFLSLYDFLEGTPQKSFCIKHKRKGYIRLFQISDYRDESNSKTIFLPKNKARRIAYKNDILIAKIGSLGSIFKAKHMGAYGANLAKITPIIHKDELNNDFVIYYLRSNLYQSIVRAINNKAVQQYLSNKDLMKLIIPIPPLAEQKRIVQRLDQILPKIDGLNKDVIRLHSLRKTFPHRLKQSLLMEAMQGKLTKQLPSDGDADELLQKIQQKKQDLIKAGKIRRHKKLPPISKDEIPFKIPKNWEWVKLGQISFLNSGKYIKHASKEKPINNYVYYVKVADMKSPKNCTKITTSHLYIANKENRLPVPSIIFPKRGGAIKTNRKRLVLNNNIFVDSNIMSLTPIVGTLLSFIWLFFKGLDLSDVQSGSAVPQINNKDINNILIPLPPLTEQKRIVKRLKLLSRAF